MKISSLGQITGTVWAKVDTRRKHGFTWPVIRVNLIHSATRYVPEVSLARGYRTATLMTIASSAIRNDLDVAVYLEDMLGQLFSGSKDYESLRPDVWAKSHPDSIRAHRQKEREANNTRRDRERIRRRIARTET